MKKYALLIIAALMPLLSFAQQEGPFNVRIKNDEYKIYITMNLYDKNLTVPGQEMLGEMDGYIGSTQSANRWFIVDSRLKGKDTAEIDVVNDYGSEDFTAVIKLNADGTYSYRKKDGSTLKFSVRGKWQKIPGDLEMTK